MELILLMGIQATGKSAFCRERLFRTHVRVNLDMLGTRHRETLLFQACLEGKTRHVVDNTNLTRTSRARYLVPAKAAGFAIVGYFFESRVRDAVGRNACRAESERVPELAIFGSSKQLELPSLAEGFDRLVFIRLGENGTFQETEWHHEL